MEDRTIAHILEGTPEFNHRSPNLDFMQRRPIPYITAGNDHLENRHQENRWGHTGIRELLKDNRCLRDISPESFLIKALKGGQSSLIKVNFLSPFLIMVGKACVFVRDRPMSSKK